MSTHRGSIPRICFHYLANKCEYGDECRKRHTDISELTTTQMLNFKKFQNRAAEQQQDAIQPRPQQQEPAASVVVKSDEVLPGKEAEVEAINEDDMPSCMFHPQGRCSDKNCLLSKRHRNLVDFTDEELDNFQRLITQFFVASKLRT